MIRDLKDRYVFQFRTAFFFGEKFRTALEIPLIEASTVLASEFAASSSAAFASDFSSSSLPHLPPSAIAIISYILFPNSAGLSGYIINGRRGKDHIKLVIILDGREK
ncbi:PREDICTED: uncharacterized protein LOC101295800 [Fragaria vesca subsp. vesca]